MFGKDDSPLATGLSKLKAKKAIKPTMKVHVAMSDEGPADDKYDKEEMKKLKAEMAALQSKIDNFDREDAAEQVHSGLKGRLAHLKARHAMVKTRAKSGGMY